MSAPPHRRRRAKEIRDTSRDRRTLLVSLLTAVAAGPIFLVLIFNLIASQADRARELKLPAVGHRRNAPALAAFLVRNQVTLSEAPADYEAKIRAGDLDVVLVVDAELRDGRGGGQARDACASCRIARATARRRRSGRPSRCCARTTGCGAGSGCCCAASRRPSAIRSNVEDVDLATPQQSGAIVLFLVAFYGLLASVMGGMAVVARHHGRRARAAVARAAADDARAARSSSSSASGSPSSLFNALVVTVTLAGFYLTLAFAPLPAVGIPFLFSAREFGRFLVVLLPMMLLIPAMLLYVGTRGRTYKEAQANVSVLMFVVSMVPAVQLFLQQKEPPWLVLVPVSGQYTLLRLALRGEAIPRRQLASVVRRARASSSCSRSSPSSRLLSRESILAGK